MPKSQANYATFSHPLFIASDHAGFEAKQALIPLLEQDGYQVIDFGCKNNQPCNYAIYGIKLAQQVVLYKNKIPGILICGTGIGMAMAANKVPGVLCGVAYNHATAALIKEHDNCNVLALGGDQFSVAELHDFILTYLNAQFEQGRHLPRVNYIKKYEKTHVTKSCPKK